MSCLGIALGSNLGDRTAHLERAVEFLSSKGELLQQASLYETQPVGCPEGSPPFLNTVLELGFSGDLEQLLRECQEFEQNSGRALPGERETNAPRPVDIDFLYAGDLIRSDSFLMLPHPRIRERLFVLMPLAEIVPSKTLPGWNDTVEECLQQVRSSLEGEQLCSRV